MTKDATKSTEKKLGFIEKIYAVKDILGDELKGEDVEQEIASVLLSHQGEVDRTIETFLSKQNVSTTTTQMSGKRKEQELTEDEQLAIALDLEEKKRRTETKKDGKEKMIVPLEHGVILLQNWLNEDQQLGVFHQCLELGNDPNAWSHAANGNHHRSVLNYNWSSKLDHKKDVNEPTDLFNMARQTFKKVKDMSKESGMSDVSYPDSYDPAALLAIIYPKGGNLYSHQDGVKGCVMGLSIGESVLFHFSPTNKVEDRTQVRINSGDIILFDGGVLWHGIDKIFDGSAPTFWKNLKERRGMARFNLQFRQPYYLNR